MPAFHHTQLQLCSCGLSPCFQLLKWIKHCSVSLCMKPNPFQDFTQRSTTQSSALNYYWVWYKFVVLNLSPPRPAPMLQQCDPTSGLQTNFTLHELLCTCTLPMYFSLSTSPQGFPGKHTQSLWREQILYWQEVDILYIMMMLLIWLWPESPFILSACQKWKWKQSYKPFSITKKYWSNTFETHGEFPLGTHLIKTLRMSSTWPRVCPFLVAQVSTASQPKASLHLPYLVKRHRGRCQVKISTDVSFGLNFWYSWPTLTLQDALNAKPEKSYTPGPLQVCTKHVSR